MTGISLAELDQQQSLKEPSGFQGTTFYMHKGEKIPVLKKTWIAKLASVILRKSERSEKTYTSILLSGKSESGKSTVTTTLCHRLSCMTNSPFVIKWFYGKDLSNLDKILKDLPKGLKYILIFDDVSYILDMEDAKRKKELVSALTTIRHTLGGKVITFFNIHYQKALPPALRDADFRVLTSMSDQDAANWKNTFGWDMANRSAIYRFQKQYVSSTQEGYFFVNGLEEGRNYRYRDSDPMRVALCSMGVGVRSLVYPKEECQLCLSPKEQRKYKKNARQVYDELVYKEKNGKRRADTSKATALKYWAFFTMAEKKALSTSALSAITQVRKKVAEHGIDMDELAKVIKDENKKTS